MHLGAYGPGLVSAMGEHYPRLDAVTALTEETADGYRELMGQRGRVVCIPNPAPPDPGTRARPRRAGRGGGGIVDATQGVRPAARSLGATRPGLSGVAVEDLRHRPPASRAGGADRQARCPRLRRLVRPLPADARGARERLGVRLDVPQRGLPDGAPRGDGRRVARRRLRLPDRAARHHHRRRRRASGPERPHPPPRRRARGADGGRDAAAGDSAPPRSRASRATGSTPSARAGRRCSASSPPAAAA